MHCAVRHKDQAQALHVGELLGCVSCQDSLYIGCINERAEGTAHKLDKDMHMLGVCSLALAEPFSANGVAEDSLVALPQSLFICPGSFAGKACNVCTH